MSCGITNIWIFCEPNSSGEKSMSKMPGRMQERFEALARKFESNLPERMNVLHALYDTVVDAPGTAPEYTDFRNEAHKLAGTGATFGYAELSVAARILVEEIDVVIRAETTATEQQRRSFIEAIKRIESCVNGKPSDDDDGEDGLIPLEDTDEQHDQEVGFRNHNKEVFMFRLSSHILDDLDSQLGIFGYVVHDLKDVIHIRDRMEQKLHTIVIADTEILASRPDITLALGEIRSRYPDGFRLLFVSDADTFDLRLQAVRAGGEAFFVTPLETSRVIDRIDALASPGDREPFHILIVDDDPESVSQVAHILQSVGMVTSVVTDPWKVPSIMSEAKPELILMDMYMPDCNGGELAVLVRQHESYVGVPIVFLSVEADPEKQMEALRRGADAFLTKPPRREQLVSIVTSRAEQTRAMRFFMERDSLTGLLNHSNIKQNLATELQRASRIGTELSFVMLDLDHFKSVNDTYGHTAGDKVLKSLARLLQDRLRKTDIVGRYGGEEFAVVLFNTGPETAGRIMNEIRESFSRIRQRIGKKDFFVTFSCGIASFPGIRDATGLSEAADRALYRAKEGGRNKVVVC
jgi:diguanylate cyclase (GGDEF)-like protein